eukprot:1159131-Pelagomonas_calceolata.AAC.3
MEVLVALKEEWGGGGSVWVEGLREDVCELGGKGRGESMASCCRAKVGGLRGPLQENRWGHATQAQSKGARGTQARREAACAAAGGSRVWKEAVLGARQWGQRHRVAAHIEPAREHRSWKKRGPQVVGQSAEEAQSTGQEDG